MTCQSINHVPADGAIHQINISPGGVPKFPVRAAEVTLHGLAGDRQRNRRVHGGPRRAVCLYSLEMIDLLRAEGHPIAPGTTGENVTIAGIDWARIRPGTQLLLGDRTLVQVTAYTAPCRNIAGSFIDGDSTRISQQRFPGQARLYARVLVPGHIACGDRVSVVPATR